MPMQGYMTVKAQKQGDIKGSITQRGREGQIAFIAFEHDVLSPRDAATGLPTGKRMHKPIFITKNIDRSTPLLYSALVNNENLPEVVFFFWRPAGTGSEVQYYTVKLTNANIASMRTFFPNTRIPDNGILDHMDAVSFTYQKIEWTWKDGGITSEDDWEAPVA
jgi:type VI secretion system secreted protein Hcp